MAASRVRRHRRQVAYQKVQDGTRHPRCDPLQSRLTPVPVPADQHDGMTGTGEPQRDPPADAAGRPCNDAYRHVRMRFVTPRPANIRRKEWLHAAMRRIVAIQDCTAIQGSIRMPGTTGLLPVRLDGKRVAITGGAGGIGRVMADSFTAAGAAVFVSDIDEVALAACPHPSMVADAGRAADLDRLHGPRALAALGGLDVLVNNAGHRRPDQAGRADQPGGAGRNAAGVPGQPVPLRPACRAGAAGGRRRRHHQPQFRGGEVRISPSVRPMRRRNGA